jgi:hypothetical protein
VSAGWRARWGPNLRPSAEGTVAALGAMRQRLAVPATRFSARDRGGSRLTSREKPLTSRSAPSPFHWIELVPEEPRDRQASTRPPESRVGNVGDLSAKASCPLERYAWISIVSAPAGMPDRDDDTSRRRGGASVPGLLQVLYWPCSQWRVRLPVSIDAPLSIEPTSSRARRTPTLGV